MWGPNLVTGERTMKLQILFSASTSTLAWVWWHQRMIPWAPVLKAIKVFYALIAKQAFQGLGSMNARLVRTRPLTL